MSEKTVDRVHDAIEKFKLCVDATSKQVKREVDALKFQVPDLQWPEDIRSARNAQTVGGVSLAARPMLSIPKLEQPIQLQLNQEKGSQIGVQVHPLSEDATDDTAEVFQGLYRAVEVDSRAALARSWAFERLVKAGRGIWQIRKEYDENSDHPSDQKLVIRRVYEQGSIYRDPAAVEPNAADAEYWLEIEDFPLARYQRRWPKSKVANYSDDDFQALGNERPEWITGDSESGWVVRVCAYWYAEYDTETVDWDGGSREKETRRIVCCFVNAAEELETAVWDGQYFPFIEIAHELVPFDGDRRCVGMIEPNKDAQRMFNYAASESVAMAALESKASMAVDPRQIEGYESWWLQRNVRSFPYMPYRRFVDGQDLGPPVPVQADMSKMQVNAMLLAQASDFLHAGTSTFDPSLGNQSPNVRTKGATLALQQQGEMANSHWLQLLSDGMLYEAKVVLDLMPHVYDRPGRVERILDIEDNPKQVMLNAPFQMQGKRPVAFQPPMQPMAPQPQQAPQQPPDVKHYDLSKGRYGVTVSIGKAYKSRVEQGRDELGQILQAEPELLKIFGDVYFKFLDFPGHRELSERMKKMLPPQLQDDDQQQDVKMQLDHAKQAIQQMEAKLKELEPERIKAQVQIETTKAKVQADVQQTGLQSQASVEIARMNNATKLAVARITAAKESFDAQKEDFEERLALASQQTHDSEQAALDRQHEQQQMQAQGQQQAALAEQGQQHALEQGQQAQDGTMAAQQQAADLQPQPEPGE